MGSLLDSLFGLQRLFHNGLELTTRKRLEFKGAGWIVTDDKVNGRSVVQLADPGGEGGGAANVVDITSSGGKAITSADWDSADPSETLLRVFLTGDSTLVFDDELPKGTRIAVLNEGAATFTINPDGRKIQSSARGNTKTTTIGPFAGGALRLGSVWEWTGDCWVTSAFPTSGVVDITVVGSKAISVSDWGTEDPARVPLRVFLTGDSTIYFDDALPKGCRISLLNETASSFTIDPDGRKIQSSALGNTQTTALGPFAGSTLRLRVDWEWTGDCWVTSTPAAAGWIDASALACGTYSVLGRSASGATSSLGFAANTILGRLGTATVAAVQLATNSLILRSSGNSAVTAIGENRIVGRADGGGLGAIAPQEQRFSNEDVTDAGNPSLRVAPEYTAFVESVTNTDDEDFDIDPGEDGYFIAIVQTWVWVSVTDPRLVTKQVHLLVTEGTATLKGSESTIPGGDASGVAITITAQAGGIRANVENSTGSTVAMQVHCSWERVTPPASITAGPIAALSFVDASGVPDGTYSNQALAGGSGSGAEITYTLASEALDGSVTIDNAGTGYQVGDIVSDLVAPHGAVSFEVTAVS